MWPRRSDEPFRHSTQHTDRISYPSRSRRYLDFSFPIRIGEQTRWVPSAGIPQTKSIGEEAEIILCRGPPSANHLKIPCEICIYISASESWLVDEILTNVGRSPAGVL